MRLPLRKEVRAPQCQGVDRPDLQARRRVQETGTNSPSVLISPICRRKAVRKDRFLREGHVVQHPVFKEHCGPRGRGKKSGGDGAVVTPVPIPNTAVKHRSGEDSRPRKGLENSAPPGFFLLSPLCGGFFRAGMKSLFYDIL